MRSGILLAEEPPNQLVEKFGCNDLEEAFLALSHKQETESENAPNDPVSASWTLF